MREAETKRLTTMSRPEFIHYAKDFILLMLSRDISGELEVITTLVLEDADPLQRQNFRLTIERMYKELKAPWQPNLPSNNQSS